MYIGLSVQILPPEDLNGHLCIKCEPKCSKLIKDICLIFGTVEHVYNTYITYQAWHGHQYGHHLVDIFKWHLKKLLALQYDLEMSEQYILVYLHVRYLA